MRPTHPSDLQSKDKSSFLRCTERESRGVIHPLESHQDCGARRGRRYGVTPHIATVTATVNCTVPPPPYVPVTRPCLRYPARALGTPPAGYWSYSPSCNRITIRPTHWRMGGWLYWVLGTDRLEGNGCNTGCYALGCQRIFWKIIRCIQFNAQLSPSFSQLTS